jgi:hypothetical protein
MRVKVTLIFENKEKVETTMSLFHPTLDFVFTDNKDLKMVRVDNRNFYTKNEVDAFFAGVFTVKSIIENIIK